MGVYILITDHLQFQAGGPINKDTQDSPPSLGTHGFLFYARHDGGMFHNTHLTIVLQISATDSHQTVSVGFW